MVLAPGVLVLWAAYRFGSNWREAALPASVGSLFVALAVVLIRNSYRANVETIHRNQRRQRYPDEPWRWRPDWESGRLTATSSKWGTTVLELETVPGRIGGHLAGTITSSASLPHTGWTVTLTATRLDTVIAARPRTYLTRTELWTGSCSPAMSATVSGPCARFDFALPDDVSESNDGDPRHEVSWLLSVNAPSDGNFSAAFPVPVFR